MRGPRQRRCRTTALAAIVALTLVLALGTGVALLLAPAVALFCLLMLGLRPGEQILERLRDRRRRPREHRAPRTVAALRLAIVPPRTSWLAASPLAMRPPPARPLPTS